MTETKEILKPTIEGGRAETRRPESMVDQGAELVLPREVESWMERVEKDTTQLTTVSDQNGQPILTPAAPSNPKIQLPVTRKTFVAGFKKAIDETGRWLTAWIFRLIKIKKGQVVFKEE